MNGRKIADALLRPAIIETKISTFKMRRVGQFLAKWTTDHTKCGPKTAQPIYTYEVNIECDPVLDSNGFIIDNLTIHEYFVKTYGTIPRPAVSCERMAAHGVKSIKRECDRVGTKVRKIAVTVSGMPGAELTAEWSRL